MTAAEATQIVVYIQSVFPKSDWTSAIVRAWVEELLAFDFQPAQAAARECFRRYRFAPSWPEYFEQLRPLLPKMGHALSCACEGGGWLELADRTVKRCPGPVVAVGPAKLTALPGPSDEARRIQSSDGPVRVRAILGPLIAQRRDRTDSAAATPDQSERLFTVVPEPTDGWRRPNEDYPWPELYSEEET